MTPKKPSKQIRVGCAHCDSKGYVESPVIAVVECPQCDGKGYLWVNRYSINPLGLLPGNTSRVFEVVDCVTKRRTALPTIRSCMKWIKVQHQTKKEGT